MREILLTLAIIVLIVVIGKNSTNRESNPIIITDTVYQEKTFTKYIKGKSIPFVVLDTIYKIDIDTITIVKDYNQVKIYSDTMRIDSLGYAYIQDTISHNSIIGRSFMAQISEKVIYKTIYNDRKPKNELYLGFIGDLRHDNGQFGVGGSIGLKTAKNSLITLNATMNGYSFGYYKKF